MSLPATSDLGLATLYSALVSANSSFKATVWSEKVLRTQKENSIWKNFTGAENSGMPVIEKQDLSKGMAEKVTFTTIAPIRGQGVLGENELKSATSKLNFGTFDVTVDLIRHGVAWSQILTLLRLRKQNVDQLTSDLMGEWYTRKKDDDIQIKLRQRALLVSPGDNLYYINGRTSELLLRSTDTLNTTEVEASKGILISHGADEIALDTDAMGASTPKYIFFAPDAFLRRMRSQANFLATVQNGGVRGDGNQLFSGKYPLWDNNVLVPHNIKFDDGDGRQGSPLYPIAFVGTALADATPTTVTGGGVAYAAGTGDYFAYFPGFAWKIYDSETLPTDSGTHYAMIYNHQSDGKYEVISYLASGVHATGKQLTTVIRGTTTGLVGGGTCEGNVTAQAAGRFSVAHPSGAAVIPCTRQGVPLNWAIHMGGGSLYHATGLKDAERITYYDDFINAAGEAQLNAVGIQGVRGMETFVDKRSMAKNFMVVAGAGRYAGINPEAY